VLAASLHTELLSRREKERERKNEEKLANGERERERERERGQGADGKLSKPPGEDKHHNCSKLESYLRTTQREGEREGERESEARLARGQKERKK
jgi:hypothetical protein